MSAATTMERDDLADRDRRIEGLLADVEAAVGPTIWPRVETLIAELVDVQGRVLRRILDHARAAAPAASSDLDERLASDVLVASVLLLHDLHPVPVEARVARALARVRVEMPSAAPLAMERIEDGIALLRTDGEGRAPATELVARAVELEAPELAGVRMLGGRTSESPLLPAHRLRRGGPPR